MKGAVDRDMALVRRLLAGDEDAFTTFFQGYYGALFRFALVRLGHDAEATEEVVQSALSTAITRLSAFRGEAALLTWLCTFCRYEISAHFKRLGRRPKPVELLEEVPEIRAALESLVAAESGRPDDDLRRKEIGRLVRLTLDHLPPRYGWALEWKYVDGLSVKEIARRLEVGPKAAESLLTRARKAFRDGFSAIDQQLARGAA